jgi:hypothetical protein
MRWDQSVNLRKRFKLASRDLRARAGDLGGASQPGYLSASGLMALVLGQPTLRRVLKGSASSNIQVVVHFADRVVAAGIAQRVKGQQPWWPSYLPAFDERAVLGAEELVKNWRAIIAECVLETMA